VSASCPARTVSLWPRGQNTAAAADAIVRFSSDDGRTSVFKIADGGTVADLRVFDLTLPPRPQIYAEVMQGDFIIPLFDSIELFAQTCRRAERFLYRRARRRKRRRTVQCFPSIRSRP
jgi:hypothetical protein